MLEQKSQQKVLFVVKCKDAFCVSKAVLIDLKSRPQNVKRVLKMGFFGKTPGVNGFNHVTKFLVIYFDNLSNPS